MTESMQHIVVQAPDDNTSAAQAPSGGLTAEMLASLSTSATLDALTGHIRHCVRALGYRYCLFGGRFRFAEGRVQQVILSGYPAAWMQLYVENNYAAIDPVVEHAYARPTPLIWDRALFDTAARQTMWMAAEAHGVGSGVTVPVAGGPNEIAILSAAGGMHDASAPPDTLPIIGQLYLIAAQAHEAIRPHLRGGTLLDVDENALSAREKECLGWWAAGKTADDIAERLALSTRTVRFHLDNVKRKLGARNRAEALSRAIQLGLIRP